MPKQVWQSVVDHGKVHGEITIHFDGGSDPSGIAPRNQSVHWKGTIENIFLDGIVVLWTAQKLDQEWTPIEVESTNP